MMIFQNLETFLPFNLKLHCIHRAPKETTTSCKFSRLGRPGITILCSGAAEAYVDEPELASWLGGYHASPKC